MFIVHMPVHPTINTAHQGPSLSNLFNKRGPLGRVIVLDRVWWFKCSILGPRGFAAQWFVSCWIFPRLVLPDGSLSYENVQYTCRRMRIMQFHADNDNPYVHFRADQDQTSPLIPPKHIQACVAVSQRPSIAVMFLPWILLGFFGQSAGLCEQDHFTDLGHVMSLVHDHHTRHGGTELQMGSHFHKINIDL